MRSKRVVSPHLIARCAGVLGVIVALAACEGKGGEAGARQATLAAEGGDQDTVDPSGVDPSGVDPSGVDPSAVDQSADAASIDHLSFPVLLLPQDLSAGAVTTTGPSWYAMSYHEEGSITVSIHATDTVHVELDPAELAALPPAEHTVRGEPGRTTVNDGIRSIAWVAHDAAYVVEVECWHVEQDRRCTSPAYAIDVANRLIELPR